MGKRRGVVGQSERALWHWAALPTKGSVVSVAAGTLCECCVIRTWSRSFWWFPDVYPVSCAHQEPGNPACLLAYSSRFSCVPGSARGRGPSSCVLPSCPSPVWNPVVRHSLTSSLWGPEATCDTGAPTCKCSCAAKEMTY